jgi:hypothetical protein
MIHALQFMAVLSSALFAGAALFISVVEHPARMGLDTGTAASQWAPSYKRATWLQAPLAVVGLVSCVGVWLLSGSVVWLVAGVILGAVVPFTYGVIMPTNHKLLAPGRDLSSAETRGLLVQWGRLHAWRTALSLIATVILLLQFVGA